MCSTRAPTRRLVRPRLSAISAQCESPASSTPWPTGSARESGVAPPSVSGVGFTASAASLPELTLDRLGTDSHARSPTVTSCDPTRPAVLPDSSSVAMAAVVGQLRTRLRTHHPVDERESLSKAIMLPELNRLDRPFDEAADLTHVTASAIVVGRRGVVLHRHRRLDRWMQPGGHLERGARPEAAA